ncbi:hypothetical protein [Bradyrhizobium sp. 164]|uniref:hypothetical protein n=1 Tax=Bradyrhizobium sp. 164 TaxID=2782637 RepID=UPI001FF72DCF|nr:hypothetical protein [Bradyrhizobium sp. 164]MCK1593787.1 hypothetical protein [Bradyrhizobium sp. 164]
MLAHFETWERAIAASLAVRRMPFAELVASGEPVPAPLRDAARFCILNPIPPRRASPKVQRLADAVQDVEKRMLLGATPNDALRAACEVWGYKESVLDNAALKRTRSDVNEEMRQRAKLNLVKTC